MLAHEDSRPLNFKALAQDAVAAELEAKVQLKCRELDDTGSLDIAQHHNLLVHVIRAAVEEVVPVVEKQKGKVRERSEHSKLLFVERARLCSKLEEGSAEWWRVKKSFTKEIAKSCRWDWRDYVSGLIDEMAVAAERNDSREVYRLVKKVAGKGKKMAVQPTLDSDEKDVRYERLELSQTN